MIKVMIVEDEPPIMRDIKALVESANSEFKVVETASNGYQAILLLENHIPDVIFTDIQMPVVSGLELISYIKEKDLDIMIVILSGFNDFTYTKKAIVFGVEDYLLKPVNEDELEKLLSKLENKLMNRRIELKKRFFSNIIKNDIYEERLKKDMPLNSSYFMMLFCAGSFPTYTVDYYSPRREFWEKVNLEKVALEFINTGDSVWVVDGKTGAEKVAVFTLNDAKSKTIDYLTNMISFRLFKSDFSITIAVSSFFHSADETGQVLQNLRSLINKKIIIGSSQIFKLDTSENNRPTSKDIPCIDSSTENKLVHSLQQGNIQSFKSDLQKLFYQWESSLYPQIWIEELLREIVFVCVRSIPEIVEYNATELGHEINEAISISCNYEELFENTWYIFEILFNARIHNNTENDSILILLQKVEKYISLNLAQPISNQTLSEIFGLVPSYLSKLFRKYKGMSPTDYLVHLRIEKAKEMLQSRTDLFAKDIAEIIGYSDPLYFSKIFKKETGLSPSDYKRNFSQKI